MGIIRAVTSSIGGGLADQWLEFIQANDMGEKTVMTTGTLVRKNDKRNQNRKGSEDFISDGSVILVEVNQCMLLVDGGKIIDYSAEPGYYKVSNSTAPSMFSGNLKGAISETFQRIKFGGVPSQKQKVYYINTQEIKNIAFGTTQPLNYFDNFYNAELHLRAHGYFSIRVTDPLLFFQEVISRNAERVQIEDIHKLYLSEFLMALQSSMNQMSVDGIRISHVSSKGMELAKYMSNVLDEDWRERRGMQIESVGISSISYDEESKKLINMRNQGAMLSDPTVREGYVQGSVARGMEAAGSNAKGATQGFMGMNMGMGTAGSFMGAASASNQAQMQQQEQQKAQHNAAQTSAGAVWKCSCGAENTGNFCGNCGQKQPEALEGKFCQQCGAKAALEAKFCGNCGNKL